MYKAEGMYEQPDEEQIMHDIDQAFARRLARLALVSWRNRAVAFMQGGRAERPRVPAAIPPQLATRISMALAECESPAEVCLVFASVQEQQLESDTPDNRMSK